MSSGSSSSSRSSAWAAWMAASVISSSSSERLPASETERETSFESGPGVDMDDGVSSPPGSALTAGDGSATQHSCRISPSARRGASLRALGDGPRASALPLLLSSLGLDSFLTSFSRRSAVGAMTSSVSRSAISTISTPASWSEYSSSSPTRGLRSSGSLYDGAFVEDGASNCDGPVRTADERERPAAEAPLTTDQLDGKAGSDGPNATHPSATGPLRRRRWPSYRHWGRPPWPLRLRLLDLGHARPGRARRPGPDHGRYRERTSLEEAG